MRYLLLLCCMLLFSCKKHEDKKISKDIVPKVSEVKICHNIARVYRAGVPEQGCRIYRYYLAPNSASSRDELGVTDTSGYFGYAFCEPGQGTDAYTLVGVSSDTLYMFSYRYNSLPPTVFNLKHYPVYQIVLSDTSVAQDTVEIECADYFAAVFYEFSVRKRFYKYSGDTVVNCMSGSTNGYIRKNGVPFPDLVSGKNYFVSNYDDTIQIHINY